MAFYALFSFAPILILAIALAGAIFGTESAQQEILRQIRTLIGPSGQEAAQLLLKGARNSETGRTAAMVAGVFLLMAATSAFVELKESLDEIWHVSASANSGILGIIRARLLSFGLVLVLAFLLLVSLVFHAGVVLLMNRIGGLWAEAGLLLATLTSVVSFGVIACLFAVIYKMLPEVRLSWQDVWIGAIGTAMLFSAGKYLIGAYLGNSAIAHSYGAVGSVLALLLWVYFSAQIFFLGAEFTRQYALWFGSMRDSLGREAERSLPPGNADEDAALGNE